MSFGPFTPGAMPDPLMSGTKSHAGTIDGLARSHDEAR